MQAHAHAERPGLTPCRRCECHLGGDTGDHTIACCVEDSHEPVAGRLDDPSARALDGIDEEAVVLCERVAHGLGVSLPQASTALHIGEEEGECAGDGGSRRFDGHGAHVTGPWPRDTDAEGSATSWYPRGIPAFGRGTDAAVSSVG